MTALPDSFSQAQNVHMEAIQHGEEVVFLHSVKPGPANQSYGLHVAALAGVPSEVIDIAKKRLNEMETINYDVKDSNQQADLFQQSEVSKRLKQINPDTVSPRQALELLYELSDLEKIDKQSD